LKTVVAFIGQIAESQSNPSVSPSLFVHTDQLEKEARSRGKFGRNEFVLDEFNFINRCSYFDYQRHRMAARSTRPARKLVRGERIRRTYKNNKIVELYASKCPLCRSRRLQPVRPLKQQVVDLRFSGAAIRRWIVLYLSQQYRCLKCGQKFVPDGFPQNRTRFGKHLLCWCMYQIFIGGQNMMRVRDGLARMFGIFLPVPSMYRFKQTVSAHYKEIYDSIARTIIGSPFSI
jgi:DNA-directed RNA polymerase subunit RPC12/RpoP